MTKVTDLLDPATASLIEEKLEGLGLALDTKISGGLELTLVMMTKPLPQGTTREKLADDIKGHVLTLDAEIMALNGVRHGVTGAEDRIREEDDPFRMHGVNLGKQIVTRLP